ncbi:MAG: KH domain-containing protein [Pedosphaera sp.]|nr:KH domain-containing protein [Pedosphaera sp.]
MQSFLEYVVKGLVTKPESVDIRPVEQNGGTLFELRLDPEDVGRVIGRRGVTISAIRSLLESGSAKQGKRCRVEIVEEAGSGN